jgi:ATP-dependent RNA helicase DDX3X
LGDALNLNIRRCKYVKPTPVQRYAIPISIAGRDLMACAQTGSGKTAAFCFPIISGILKSRPPQRQTRSSRTACPLALILSPTRELSVQVCQTIIYLVSTFIGRSPFKFLLVFLLQLMP